MILGLLEEGPLPKSEIIEKIGEDDADFSAEVIGKMIEMKLIKKEKGELIRL